MNRIISKVIKLIPRKNKARSHAIAVYNYLTIPINGKINFFEAKYHFKKMIQAIKK